MARPGAPARHLQAPVGKGLRGAPRWPGEVDLHRGAAGRLLPVLVRRRPVSARLARLPAWQALAGAWAAQDGAVRALAAPVAAALAQALAAAAAGAPDAAAGGHYVERLMAGVAGAGRPRQNELSAKCNMIGQACAGSADLGVAGACSNSASTQVPVPPQAEAGADGPVQILARGRCSRQARPGAQACLTYRPQVMGGAGVALWDYAYAAG